MSEEDLVRVEQQGGAASLPAYESPQVLTYRGADILEALGPAQACSFSHSVVACGESFGPPDFGG